MIVLARVNGYYSPHFPMSVMEEEDKAFHNTNFSYAETDFFTNKLKQVYPKIDTESLKNTINFLERQKEANCPCSIHTQKRGYDWTVFSRLPDKLSSNTTTFCSDIEDDEDESGAASENYSSADLTAGYNAIFNPKVQNSSNDFFLTSRDIMHIRNKIKDQARQNQKQMKNPTRNDVPFSVPRQKDTDEENEEPTMDMLDEGDQSVDSNKPSKFDPLVKVDNEKGKTYCYKYFRPYKYDWRLLLTNDNGESIECTCPRAGIHGKKCVWYNPNYINIPDTRNDLSISEQAALGKIYDMFQNTQNGQEELCGCGTSAEIAYLGHKSTCEEFQWIHERSSYEILLANLEKRQKETLFKSIKQNKRPRLQSTSDFGKKEEITKDAKAEINMNNPSTPHTAPSSLALLAEVVQSHSSLSSLPDLIGEQNCGADFPCEDDEEMPPLEGDDAIEL